MRLLVLVLIFLGASLTGAARADEPIDFGAAIDQAGAQRMLSQRIVKAFVQVGLDVDVAGAKKQLEQSVLRFETQLAYLKRMAPAVEAGEQVARLEQAWQPFRQTALATVSRDNARRLHMQGERVVAESQALVQHLQERAGSWEGHLVNISGRQRMLSQRLAKIYLLRVYGIDSPQMREQAIAAQSEFHGALLRLQEAHENTPEIGRELRSVALQWEWFLGSLALEGVTSYPAVVADASEKILEQMERVTALYARLAGSRKP